MPSLKSLVADLHKPWSAMLGKEEDWYEGKDFVAKPDLRSEAEHREEEVYEELLNNHIHD